MKLLTLVVVVECGDVVDVFNSGVVGAPGLGIVLADPIQGGLAGSAHLPAVGRLLSLCIRLPCSATVSGSSKKRGSRSAHSSSPSPYPAPFSQRSSTAMLALRLRARRFFERMSLHSFSYSAAGWTSATVPTMSSRHKRSKPAHAVAIVHHGGETFQSHHAARRRRHERPLLLRPDDVLIRYGMVWMDVGLLLAQHGPAQITQDIPAQPSTAEVIIYFFCRL